MQSKVFCGHSNLRWTKKPTHWCVSPASTPNSEPSTRTTFFIFLRTGFLSWHPRISAMRIQMQKVLIWKTKLTKFVGSTGRTCQATLTATSCRGQGSFCPSLSSSLIFFFMCAHPSVRGIKFFYPNNTRFGQIVTNENGISHVWPWTPSQGPEDSASVVWSKISWSWVGLFSFK